VLDNCRLDYVFEPDWERLIGRVCGLLTSAKTVAWWQDGGPSDAAQSCVLADPAGRFVRDNVNVFLLGCPVERPLRVVQCGAVAGALGSLLDTWQRSTDRSELVAEAFLRDRRDPVDGPRMAVQAFFSSAVDALVVGRFLLMKDYWLMRLPQPAAGQGHARDTEVPLLQARA
jgi:predicted NodU family carbamoyl transferase